MNELLSYPYTCTDCKDTGWRQKQSGGESGVIPCACRTERIQETRLSQIFDQNGQYAEARLDRFDAVNAGQRAAHGLIVADPIGSFFLRGLANRGKTWLLVAQYRWMLKKGIPAQLRTSKQLLEELASPETSALMELASTADRFHLFWDAIEMAGSLPDFQYGPVCDLLDLMRRRNLGITMTSRFPLTDTGATPSNPIDLTYKLGNPIVTRLAGMCRSILL